MTYATVESSVQTGRPVELYEFLDGSTAYRYTSADGDVVYGGNTYTAVPISRSAVEATSEVARLALNITCSRDVSILDLFSLMPPAEIVSVTVRRLHSGDGEAITLWMGRILDVAINPDSAEIHCESVYTSLKRVGLRRLYQKNCPHVLFEGECALNRAAFSSSQNVVSVAGTMIELDSLGSFDWDYFSGGYLEWESTTGYFQRRAIRSRDTDSLIISFPLPGLAASDVVTIYPGCNHTLATCEAKFSNNLNFGGMPYWPTKNPFDGTIIY